MSDDLASAIAITPRDDRPWAPATVLSVDVAGARLLVDLDGAPVEIRRIAAPYRPGDTVAVVRDPSTAGAGQFVAGIISSAPPVWLPGVITQINTGTGRITATVNNTSMVLPYVAGTYAVGNTVAVLLDSASGMGALVLGPMTFPPTAPGVPLTPATPATPTTVRVEVPVLPTWSGTWRDASGAWDRWNATRYGGRSDVYQGNGYGSGQLRGLATYGDQIVALGLSSIESIVVQVRRNGSGADAAVSVQCSPHGSQPAGAPTSSGDVATSAVLSATGSAEIALTATMREALRTGAARALALVGSTYAGVYGAPRPVGMALAIVGTKAV